MAASNQNLSLFTQFGRKIVGVGFNYKSNIKETAMLPKKVPRLYMKATTSYITKGQMIQIPEWSPGSSLIYQVELGVIIGKQLRQATETDVLHAIGGFCTALDLTCKHMLTKAMDRRLSWALAKSFDSATPVGDFIEKDRIRDMTNVELWLKVNGVLKQQGNSSDMTWPVTELISIISRYMTLERGDMILTGTPAGMGALTSGDVIEAGNNGVDQICFKVQ